MTNAERAASAINVRKVSWNGINVNKDVPNVLSAGRAVRAHQRRAIAALRFGAASFGRPADGAGSDRRRGARPR